MAANPSVAVIPPEVLLIKFHMPPEVLTLRLLDETAVLLSRSPVGFHDLLVMLVVDLHGLAMRVGWIGRNSLNREKNRQHNNRKYNCG